MSCRRRLLEWATVAAGSRVRRSRRRSSARRSKDKYSALRVHRPRDGRQRSSELGLVRRGGDGPMRCWQPCRSATRKKT